MNNNVLKDKSYAFAIQVVKTSEKLISERKEFVLAKQLLRSGTAIGALIREAEFAQSKQTSSIRCQLHLRKQMKLFIGCLC